MGVVQAVRATVVLVPGVKFMARRMAAVPYWEHGLQSTNHW
jgi:hypothetical protein